MNSNYWIKLYEEILDDSKMAILPDRLWRRIIELFLLAGRYMKDGELPETKEMAWSLRLSTDDLDMDLKQIESIGIIQRTATGWFIPRFKDRQAKMTDAERMKRYRNRVKQDQYYGSDEDVTVSVTTPLRNVTQITDNRLQITDNNIKAEADKKFYGMMDAEKAYLQVTKFSAVSPSVIPYLEGILSMIQVHGWDATIQRMETAYESWIHKRRKDGGNYSKTNPAWIEYAIADESLGTPKTTREDRTMIELEALQKGLRG